MVEGDHHKRLSAQAHCITTPPHSPAQVGMCGKQAECCVCSALRVALGCSAGKTGAVLSRVGTRLLSVWLGHRGV